MPKSILPISAILAAPFVLTVGYGDKNQTDHGYYAGSGTFPMAGDCEGHFHYMYESEADHVELLMGFTVQ